MASSSRGGGNESRANALVTHIRVDWSAKAAKLPKTKIITPSKRGSGPTMRYRILPAARIS